MYALSLTLGGGVAYKTGGPEFQCRPMGHLVRQNITEKRGLRVESEILHKEGGSFGNIISQNKFFYIFF